MVKKSCWKKEPGRNMWFNKNKPSKKIFLVKTIGGYNINTQNVSGTPSRFFKTKTKALQSLRRLKNKC